MPTDVLLLLASSSLSVVASLLYLVAPPAKRPAPPPGPEVSYCAPPPRPRPPPLRHETLATAHGRFALVLADGAWHVTWGAPRADCAARSAAGQPVSDVRWHGRALLPRAPHAPRRVPPAKA